MPDTFWTTLRSASLQDGSLARFLIFRSTDDIPDRNRTPALLSDVPSALIEALKSVAAGAPRVRPRQPRRHRRAHRHPRSLSGANGAGRPAAVR